MFDDNLEETALIPGLGGDYARDRIAEPPLPFEQPGDTESRLDSQAAIEQRVQLNVNRMKGIDLAQRSIPAFTDPSGNVQAVTDAAGQPVTNYDRRHNVGWDSSGGPVQVSYGATGPPKVEDAFTGVQPTTDPKTGAMYRIRPGLPWDYAGQDPDATAAALEAQKDKATKDLSSALGRKLTLDEHAQTRAQVDYKHNAKALASQFGLDGTEGFDDIAQKVDQHFNNPVDGYGSPQANQTEGWFGGGSLSPDAQAYRGQIDQRKADALQRVAALKDASDKIQTHGAAVEQERAQRDALLQAQVERQTQKALAVGATIPGLRADGQEELYQKTPQGTVVTDPGRPYDAIKQASDDGAIDPPDPHQLATAQLQQQQGQAQDAKLQQSVQAAKAGQKPYGIDDAGKLKLSDEKPFDSITQAVSDGLMPEPPPEVLKAAQQKQQLIEQAGQHPEIKAALAGAGRGAAFLAGSPVGAGIGAEALSETGPIGAAAGGIIGGLVTGSLAAHAYGKVLEKLGEYNDTINSFVASQKLHPIASGIGELAAFGSGLPTLATKAVGALAGRGADALAEASAVPGSTVDAIRATQAATKAAQATGGKVASTTGDVYSWAAKALDGVAQNYQNAGGVVKTVQGLSDLAKEASKQATRAGANGTLAATQAVAARVAIAAGGMAAIDTAWKEAGYGLGLTDEHQSLGGAGFAALLGALTAGHGLSNPKYEGAEGAAKLEDIMMRGWAHDFDITPEGPKGKPGLASTGIPDVPDAAKAMGITEETWQRLQSASRKDPLTPEERELYSALNQAAMKGVADGTLPADHTQWQLKASQILVGGRRIGVANAEVEGGAGPTPAAGGSPKAPPKPPKPEPEPEPLKPGAGPRPTPRTKKPQGPAPTIDLDENGNPLGADGKPITPAAAATPAAPTPAPTPVAETPGTAPTPRPPSADASGAGSEAPVAVAAPPAPPPASSEPPSAVPTPLSATVKGESQGQSSAQPTTPPVAAPVSNAGQPPPASGGNTPAVAPAPSVDQAAHEAATSPQNDLTEPTQPQQEAGNYKKGPVQIGPDGSKMRISIENPAGSLRKGVDREGNAWSTKMESHYGYIRSSVGKDGDHIDAFIKPGTPGDYNGPVFVVNQNHPDGTFDEHKAVIGAGNEEEARKLYLANYQNDQAKNIGSVAKFNDVASFKQWATGASRRTAPAKGDKPAPAPESPKLAKLREKAVDAQSNLNAAEDALADAQKNHEYGEIDDLKDEVNRWRKELAAKQAAVAKEEQTSAHENQPAQPQPETQPAAPAQAGARTANEGKGQKGEVQPGGKGGAGSPAEHPGETPERAEVKRRLTKAHAVSGTPWQESTGAAAAIDPETGIVHYNLEKLDQWQKTIGHDGIEAVSNEEDGHSRDRLVTIEKEGTYGRLQERAWRDASPELRDSLKAIYGKELGGDLHAGAEMIERMYAVMEGRHIAEYYDPERQVAAAALEALIRETDIPDWLREHLATMARVKDMAVPKTSEPEKPVAAPTPKPKPAKARGPPAKATETPPKKLSPDEQDAKDALGDLLGASTPKGVATTEPRPTPKVITAYTEMVRKSGFQAVPIGDLARQSDTPLDALKSQVLALHNAGKVVLSQGDWSLSNETTKAGAVTVNGDRFLQVRFLPVSEQRLGASTPVNYDTPTPPEKSQALDALARKFINRGNVTTPEALARVLSALGPKAHAYAQNIWRRMQNEGAQGPDRPEWAKVFSPTAENTVATVQSEEPAKETFSDTLKRHIETLQFRIDADKRRGIKNPDDQKRMEKLRSDWSNAVTREREAAPIAPPVEASPKETKAAEKLANAPETLPAKLKVQKAYLLDALDKAITEATVERTPAFATKEGASDSKELADFQSYVNPVQRDRPRAEYKWDKTEEEKEEDTQKLAAWEEKASAQLAPLFEKYGVSEQSPELPGYTTLAGETATPTPLQFDERITALRTAINERDSAAHPRIEISVPGDGDFRIINTKEALTKFRDEAKKHFPTKGATPDRGPASARITPTAIPPLGKPKGAGALVRIAGTVASHDETRYVITHVMSDGKRIIGTDGRRLLMIDGKAGGTEAKPVLFNPKTLAITETGKEGEALTFPSWKQVVPTKYADQIKGVDTGALMKLLIQAQTMVSEKSNSFVLLRDASNKLSVRSNDPGVGEFEGGEADPATAKQVAAFNPEFFIDGLRAARALGHEEVALQLTDAMSPVVIVAPGMKYVLMPMRIGASTPTAVAAQRAGGAAPGRPQTGLDAKRAAQAAALASKGGLLASAVDRAKAVAGALYRHVMELPKYTEFDKLIGEWQGAGDASEADSTGRQIVDREAKLLMKAMRQTIPNPLSQMAAMRFIDTGGDDTLMRDQMARSTPAVQKLYERALSLDPAEKEAVKTAIDYYESEGQRMLDAGLLKQLLDNYVGRIIDRSTLPDVDKDGLKSGFGAMFDREFPAAKLRTKLDHALRRTHEFIFDLEQKKIGLKTQMLPEAMAAYSQAVGHVIADRVMVAGLRKVVASDGRPGGVLSGFAKKIEGDETSAGVLLVKPSAKGEEYKDYLPLNHPAFRGWKFMGADENGKLTLMEAEMLVHPEFHQRLKNTLGTSALNKVPGVRAITTAQYIAKQVMLGWSVFHIVQTGTHFAASGINPFRFHTPDPEDPFVRMMLNHGLNLWRYDAKEHFGEGVAASGLGKWLGPLGRINDALTGFTFEEYIPGLIYHFARIVHARNLKRFAKELASGKMTEDDVAQFTAREANGAGGFGNERYEGDNPTRLHAERLAFLAPRFLKDRAEWVGRAFTKHGVEERRALFILAIAMAVTAKLLERMLTGKNNWNKPFTVVTAHREYELRSVPSDVLDLLQNPRRFVSGRLSPLIARPTLEAITGRDYRGRKRSAGEQLMDLIKTPIPIAVRGFVDKDAPELSPGEQLGASAGFRARRHSVITDVRILGHAWQQQHGMSNPDEVYPPSKYLSLRNALEDSNLARAEHAYAELQKTTPKATIDKGFLESTMKPFSGSAAHEREFIGSLSPAERQQYASAIAERARIRALFLQMSHYQPKAARGAGLMFTGFH